MNRCAWCGCIIKGFSNEISRIEYGISRLCEDCQDEVFEID